MELRFQSHAVLRMQERNISVADIELVLASPDGSIRQSKDKIIFYKKLSYRKDNRLAAVVVERVEDDFIEVITVLINFEVKK